MSIFKTWIFAVVVIGSLAGCKTLIPDPVIDNVVNIATNQVPVVVPDVPPATVTTQTLWDAVTVNWMIHGEGTGENEIRAAAIQEASESGKAIRFKFRYTITDLRIWTVHWESDQRKGYFGPPDVWSTRAFNAGVRRWVVEPCDDDALMIDTFKAYGGTEFQLQVVNPSPGVVKGLGLDSNGVKTSAPRYR